MTSPITPGCDRGVLSLDHPDDTPNGMHPVGAPSAALLDRAMVGWERFLGSSPEPSDG